MAKWPYNTPEWNRLREQKLKHSPVCEHCDRRGKLVTANTIDHVVAISKGGPPFPGLDGLMSLCATCHNQKTAAVDKPGSSGLSLKGCGPDGLPLDPAHHAWGYPIAGWAARDVVSRAGRLRTRSPPL
jgi:hypothetical protein